MDVLVPLLIGAAAGVAYELFSMWRKRGAPVEAQEKLRESVQKLSRSTELMREIESEPRVTPEAAERVQREVAQAQQALVISQGQVQEILNKIESESRRGFWLGFLVNFLFFAAGVGVAFVVQ
jgi:hypothetical protein